MKTYDVIVIGAGNGGLAAAATCARAGLSTLLLERHNIPGGSATSFVRGRFEFEPSLHELAGTSNPPDDDTAARLFQRIDADCDFLSHESTFRLVVPAKEGDTDTFINEDGVEVSIDARMPIGFEAFSRKLDELVPGSYESARKAFDLSIRMFETLNALEDPAKLPAHFKDFPDILRMGAYNMNDVLDTLGMPKKAQDIFNTYWCYLGVPGDKLDFLYYMAMLYSYVKNGTSIPHLRSHEMSLALDKVIRDNGGDIWYNSEVTKMIMKDGKPAGVVINGKKEVYGKRFICNSFPDRAWKDLFDFKDIPERQLKLMNARTVSTALTTVYLGMNKSIKELGINDYSTFIAPTSDSDEQFALVDKYFSGYCIINCLNEIIPDSSPDGTCTLFLTGMTIGDIMKDVEPKDYKKFKTKVAKDMIETCEKALNIEIMPYIEEIEIGLPPTFARYLNTPQGTPYGYWLEKWDSMLPRTIQFEADKPFENFIFCGASQERGDGYYSAYYTGEKAANLTIKALKKEGK